jgi:hypothetical protein
MKKSELKQELDETKKEVKTLRREINKLRGRWKYFDKAAKIVAFVAWTYIAWQIAQYGVGYAMIFALGYSRYSEPFWLTITYLLTYSLTILLIVYVPKFIHKIFKTNKKELGLTEMPTFTDIGIALLGYVTTFILAAIVISILGGMGIINASEQQEIGFHNLVNGSDRALAYVAIAVIAPIAEEVIFRGWLYGKLRKELKMVPAIIIVSVFFGFLHGQLSAGISVGILSVIMCLEREITGTIHAGIITHMIQNSLAFAILIAQGRL